ncbi:MAG: class I SAM-dependent methyltransferase [Gammaproteobacteria bacterium]|nr:class I SAM-dependent methyltransferase [Gammaproteobacteria bacterium]MCP5424422.1 class I SAM-dependent methyltransferase [Gammaproteobacteria bacterium]MCP5458416.1 class I SAM-dependent methyltransferase [Gammaproteobacteria bacterium]
MSDSLALGFTNAMDYARARELLSHHEYSPEGIGKALGEGGALSMHSSHFPIWLRRTNAATPLNTLIRLFLLNVPVDADRARQALEPMDLASWEKANLLSRNGEHVVPQVQIQTHGDLLLASDMPSQLYAGHRSDYVMGIARSSMLLVNQTLRGPVRRALDLGAGCGIQALLCAPHSGQVWATDQNPRAAMFTGFNARLNGIDNLQTRIGDLFEPFAGERFDLIVCSAPYMISPYAKFMFCESGMRGDQFCRQIVRQAPDYLEEGGFMQLICNWAHGAKQTWREGLADWFTDIGCDVLVVGGGTEDASSYATSWIGTTESESETRFKEIYDEWMDYYQREGIEAVSYGVITLRRASGKANWQCLEEVSQMAGSCGDAIARFFQSQDFLRSAADKQSILDTRFRCSPDVRFEQHFQPSAEGWEIVSARVRLSQGFCYSNDINVHVANMLARCNGERTLRDLLGELAATVNVELQPLIDQALPFVRHLVHQGFLSPGTAAAN